MNNNITVFDSPLETAENCADYLIKIMDSVLSEKEFFALAISGGATPKLLFQYLADYFPNHPGWSKTKIFWVDERCVPRNSPESNYGLINEVLLQKLHVKPLVFPVEGTTDPETEAVRYSRLIESEVTRKNDIPVFDLILLGMGDDGHTASIFPQQESAFLSSQTCVAAEHPLSGQKRITLTAGVITSSKQNVFLVTGEKKKAVVDEILNHGAGCMHYPAYRIAEMSKNVCWYLDKAAAGED